MLTAGSLCDCELPNAVCIMSPPDWRQLVGKGGKEVAVR